ncbi:hypothetical protein [Helicobacter pylori]|nr:hypothetical protein [Helicobacter pylori]VEJ22855.1 Uncharacterised protein [Helicobacter pylori]
MKFLFCLYTQRPLLSFKKELIEPGNEFEQDSIAWCPEMVEKGGKVYARFSLICTTPNPNGVEAYDFSGKIHRKCKFDQLIGKSELVSFGKDMNPNTKEFQQAYSKLYGKKFFFYKPTQIVENTLQSLKAKLDANRMKTSATGGVIGTFGYVDYEKGIQVE